MSRSELSAVLARAQELRRLETAAALLPCRTAPDLRGLWAAAVGTLLALIPSACAAQSIIH